ncbi:MAG: exo-alpha-sialidase [Acidobacteria bacterium]|nr:exo-alpha-sialidase [Acidobacteriota bacterium]MBI3424807.1 exo-alpha-sialidase [Acidobacteriota bacterium]
MHRIWQHVMVLFLLAGVWPSHVLRSSQNEISVGPNIQVSKDRADLAHWEVILAADPTDPQRLLAGSMLWYDSGEDQCIGYLSTDGGMTWKPVLEPGGRAETRGDKRAADPAVAFGPDGAAYFAMLAAEARLQSHHAVVAHSTDKGLTWSEPTHVHQPTRIDRPYITIDRTGGKYQGRVYCNGVVITDSLPGTGGTAADLIPQVGIGIFFSSDGGRTFSEPTLQRVRMANQPHAARGTGNSVVLSDGTVVALYNFAEDWRRREDSATWLGVERSVDGGQSFEPGSPASGERPPRGRVIPQFKFIGQTQRPLGKGLAGLECLASDQTTGLYRDRLYAVWPEFDGVRSRVKLSFSADKGITWSGPTPIDDGGNVGAAGTYRGAFMPSVAVNKDGVVGISWYDTRDAVGADPGWDVRFAVSYDGGKTWGPSVRVSEKSSIATAAMRKKLGRRVGPGDSAGLAASADGAFHPLWIDHRTGTPQVWTATVTLKPKP